MNTNDVSRSFSRGDKVRVLQIIPDEEPKMFKYIGQVGQVTSEEEEGWIHVRLLGDYRGQDFLEGELERISEETYEYEEALMAIVR